MVNGVNLYAYCKNNPISRYEAYGFGRNEIISTVAPKSIDIEKTSLNNKSSILNTICGWIDSNIGISVNYVKEVQTSFWYYWFFEYETGVGYSKSFNTGKPINFYINLPSEWWKVWELQVGVDANFNGYGFGFTILSETSLTFHLGKNSLDIFKTPLGRLGFKWTSENDNGSFSYYKFSLNLPEIALTVLSLYFGLSYLAALFSRFSGVFGQPVGI